MGHFQGALGGEQGPYPILFSSDILQNFKISQHEKYLYVCPLRPNHLKQWEGDTYEMNFTPSRCERVKNLSSMFQIKIVWFEVRPGKWKIDVDGQL